MITAGLAIYFLLTKVRNLPTLINFLEITVSKDHYLDANAVDFVSITYTAILLTLLLLIFCYATGLLQKLLQSAARVLDSLVDLDYLMGFFTQDEITPEYSRMTLLISSIGVLGLYFFFYFFPDIEAESPLETVTSLFFIIAAGILIRSLFLLKKSFFSPKEKKRAVIFLIGLSLALLFIFGEEISWGQHLFNWEATGHFASNNFQQETNLHNFFNPLFDLMYPLAGIAMFTTLFILWFFPKRESSKLLMILIPPPSLFPIVLFAMLYSFQGHSEIFEEYLGLFFLIHALRIYLGLKKEALAKEDGPA